MGNYTRKQGDIKYRKVSIESESTPSFREFTSPGETIQYMDFQVLEVLDKNGSSKLYHDGSVENVSYTPGGQDRLLVSNSVPLARVWMRRSDGGGIPYKVPIDLPSQGGSVVLKVPGGVQGIELYGDPYFEMVFKLKRT